MRTWLRRAMVAFSVLLALLAASGIVVLQSDWLRDYIRRRIVETVEGTTGGRVELGTFTWEWRSLRVLARDFTLHGTESAGQPPLFRVRNVEANLTVLSFWGRKVRFDRLALEGPEFNVRVDEQGRTNFPSPRVPRGATNPVENLLKLAITRLEARNGQFGFDRRRTPFWLEARDFDFELDYAAAGPRYLGRVKAREIRIVDEIAFEFEGRVRLEANRVTVEESRIRRGTSALQATGAVEDWKNPHGEARFEGEVALTDIPRSPLRDGRAQVSGTVAYSPAGVRAEGKVDGRGLVWRGAGVGIEGIRAFGSWILTRRQVEMPDLNVEALGGTFSGRGAVSDWQRFSAEGDLTGLPVEPLMKLAGNRTSVAWNGLLAGPVTVHGAFTRDGIHDAEAGASLSVEPLEGQIPVRGALNAAWRQRDNQVDLGPSWLAMPGARVDFHGALGRRLEAGAYVTRIADLEPVINLFQEQPVTLPVRLIQGEARFEGSVEGPLAEPRIEGTVRARNVEWRGRRLERVEGGIRISSTFLEINGADVSLGGSRAEANLRAVLRNWRMSGSSPLEGQVRIPSADLAMLAEQAGLRDLRGTIAGTVLLRGTLETPDAQADFLAGNVEAWGERIERAQLRFRYLGRPADEVQGSLLLDNATVDFDGVFEHPRGNYRTGRLAVQLAGKDFDLRDIERIQALRRGLAGRLQFNQKVRLRVDEGNLRLTGLDGKLSIGGFTGPAGPLGQFEIDSWTEGELLRWQGRLDLRDRALQAVGQVRLTRDYPMQAKLVVPPTGLGLLRELTAGGPIQEPLAIEGVVDGEVNAQGPLAEPGKITARAVINRVLVRPRDAQIGETSLDVTDLTLRNSGPVQFDVDNKGVHVRSAHFTARDTDLTLSGSFQFNEKAPLNLRAEGRVNLAILSTFKPDLQAAGNSLVNATLRGSLESPQLSGRMEIRGASFYLRDLPNGIDQANGLILFDRDRANIERLSGQTGGGTFEIRGFVGLAGREFTYRLLATATRIRVRYPEGVSTTLDANINLTGTSVRSLLAGNISIVRSGFNPRTDLASILAASAHSTPPAAAQNEFLQGMQLDIRVRTAPNAELQTSYTKDVQTEADLRLRGSPAKPILLGRVRINQGEVDFLGTRYRISRGDIIFYNTNSLQPAVDFDLETRVRGITVSVNFAGPITKLNVSSRSDPPLQSNDILALLAVGRTPDNSRLSLGPSQGTAGQSSAPASGGGALLGGALNASVTGRLERFFGASRLKIDPQITGIDNIPQARLTLEQQVTRDVTLTYVTNLNRSQQQVWRLEWDFSREWSVIAVRDENGLFGVDFQLRKRFK